MINGVNLNDMVQNQITFQPSINTVSEFKVDNSTYSAEYGRNSAQSSILLHAPAAINITANCLTFCATMRLTPGISSIRLDNCSLHLSATISARTSVDLLSRIRRFSFSATKGLRQRQGLTLNTQVLSSADRASVQAAGNPTSNAILGLIPISNDPTGTRFLGSATAPVNIDQGTADISHNFSDSLRLHGYYALQHDLRQEPILQGNSIPGFGDTRESRRQIATVNLTKTLSSTMVNEARLGYNRIHITFAPNATQNPADIGILDGNNFNSGLPQITIGGTGVNLGGPARFPQGRGDTTAVLSDTLSYIRGRHSFKFGGEFRRFNNNNFNGDTGSLGFLNVADFAAGTPNAFAISPGNLPSRIAVNNLGLFAQDSWKFNQRLTLELDSATTGKRNAD